MGNAPPQNNETVEPAHAYEENMIRRHLNECVYDIYYPISLIGEGSIGTVYKVTKKKPPPTKTKNHQKQKPQKLSKQQQQQQRRKKKCYAMKSIDFDRVDPRCVEELRNEINILRSMDHPNIVKAYDVFERPGDIAVVMELCTGGDLYKRIPYSENQAMRVMGQLMSALSYMHQKGVVHRDVKFENILFESPKADAEIKLIDFGLCQKYSDDDQDLTELTQGGTIYTMAPEVFDGESTSRADMWSAGVVAFMMISNKMPFWGKTIFNVVKKIQNGDYRFDPQQWSDVSSSAKELVSSLLVVNPLDRPDAYKVLHSPWFRVEFPILLPEEDIPPLLKKSLIRYASCGDIKKLALMIVAHTSEVEDVIGLRRLFEDYFDIERKGHITMEEFKMALKGDGGGNNESYDEKQLEETFHQLDLTHDGYIHYTEFLAASIEYSGEIADDKLEETFQYLDHDGNGLISKKDLRKALDINFADDYLENLIREVDKDGDGHISFQDFISLFRDQQHDDCASDSDAI